MTRRLALLAVLLLAALTAACGGADSGAGPETVDEVGGSVGDDTAALAGGAEQEQDAAGEAAEGDAGPLDGGGELGTLTATSTGDKVIKEGTISVEVATDGFERAFAEVIEAANRLGGTFVASTSRSDAGERPSGSVTVRVPVEEYENLIVGVRRIGTVRSQEITSEDVTTEYVDLRSRLRQQQAQERFFLGLLDRAEGVDDAITVQQQLQSVQEEIERIKGRLQFLDDRTAYSTLTVELFEPGAPLLATAGGAPGFGQYWETARNSFVAVTGTMFVTVVALLPLLIPVALVAAGYRRLRRRPGVVPAAPPEGV